MNNAGKKGTRQFINILVREKQYIKQREDWVSGGQVESSLEVLASRGRCLHLQFYSPNLPLFKALEFQKI